MNFRAARAMIAEQISKRDTLTIVMGNNTPGLTITEPNRVVGRDRREVIPQGISPPGMTLEEAE